MNEYSRVSSYTDIFDDERETPEYKIEECEIVTDLIDEILTGTYFSDGNVQFPSLAADDKGIQISRSNHFFSADTNGGWAWPLTEKIVDIRYTQSKTPVLMETYEVFVGAIVHQKGITEESIPTRYTVTYSGKNRTLISATIESPDIIGEGDNISIERDMVEYDRRRFFDAICELADFRDAQLHEDANLNVA